MGHWAKKQMKKKGKKIKNLLRFYYATLNTELHTCQMTYEGKACTQHMRCSTKHVAPMKLNLQKHKIYILLMCQSAMCWLCTYERILVL